MLWTTALANLGVALLATEPQSALGQLAGLPEAPVLAVYRVLLSSFIAQFGLCYEWLARRKVIDLRC